MDQQGCSSPQVIFWLGKKNNQLIEGFWNMLTEIVENNYDFDLSLTNKKTEFTSELVLREKKLSNLKFKNLKVIRYQMKNLDKIGKLENKYGAFLEVKLSNASKIKNILTKGSKH